MMSEVHRTRDIGSNDRTAMYALLARHFRGVERGQFERDLDEKQWAILLRTTEGMVVGFTTLLVGEIAAGGERIRVLHSGDTIIDRAHWGSSIMARAWLPFVHGLRRVSPLPLVWSLICSGVRTYRLLPLFYREFYPRHDRPTPPRVQALMHAIGRDRYGAAYRPERGLVVLPNPTPLRNEILSVIQARDAHARHFIRLVPNHAAGDELLCFSPIEDKNLTAAGRRLSRPSDSRA